MAQLPIIMGPQGPIPTPPATLRSQLVALVSATNPGYTANLPGSLIEDIVSTDVGALVIANQFMIDLINSVSPYGANAFILNQLGTDVYGIQPSVQTNTTVNVIFSGTPGFIIIPGFIITDGNFQYICQYGGVIGIDGDSLPINAIATRSGTWAVPAGTVIGLVTSVPDTIQLSVINPTDGIPSTATETIQSFRTRTLTAGLAASTGMDRYLKTLLWNIPGVVQRLVSVRQNINNCKWTILVGGGDPYQVAWAIYYALGGNLPSLDLPDINIINMTNTNPIVVTTEFNHNLVTKMIETFYDIIGMIGVDGFELNGNSYPVTVISSNTFSIPVDGIPLSSYQEGGIVTPNPLLQRINLSSFPDNYLIPFILPAQQLVTMVVIWNTNSPNYVSPQAISQAAVPALVDYINSLYVGSQPINIYEMTNVFVEAVANVVASENITLLNFEVSFDGVGQPPVPDTGIIPGDPFSYFYTTNNNILVNQE
jgi:hypothetical protein